MLILDSLIDKDKFPKSFILIQAEVLPHSRTLITYPSIPDSGISADNLGLAEIISASRPRHVAPRLALRCHLGHVLLFKKYAPTFSINLCIKMCRFWKVARVHGVCWLEIWGNMKTGMLSPKTTYAAFLIFKIMEKFSGLESVPMKVSVRFVGEMEVGNGKEDYGSTVYLRFLFDRPVRKDHNGRVPQKRKDKWMEIELGEFFNDEGNDDGKVDIQLREVKDLG
ncbi:hypothetical protein ACSBR2_030725 [Camellia fascicularis]